MSLLPFVLPCFVSSCLPFCILCSCIALFAALVCLPARFLLLLLPCFPSSLFRSVLPGSLLIPFILSLVTHCVIISAFPSVSLRALSFVLRYSLNTPSPRLPLSFSFVRVCFLPVLVGLFIYCALALFHSHMFLSCFIFMLFPSLLHGFSLSCFLELFTYFPYLLLGSRIYVFYTYLFLYVCSYSCYPLLSLPFSFYLCLSVLR